MAEQNHHIHVWSLHGESHVLSTHLRMAADATRGEIAEAKRKVRQSLDQAAFSHITIDVEPEGKNCTSPEKEGSFK